VNTTSPLSSIAGIIPNPVNLPTPFGIEVTPERAITVYSIGSSAA
jgi:hypothetical protein